MNDKNQLDKIKDAATGSLKIPVSAAGSALGLAKGAATAGLAAGGSVARMATDTASNLASSLMGSRQGVTPEQPRVEAPGSRQVAAKAPRDVVSPKSGLSTQEREATTDTESPATSETATSEPAIPEPVNVTQELGLDPAPIAKPKRAKKSPAKKPVTKIDRAADASDVHATPADVAKVIDHDAAGDAKADE